MTDSPRRLAPTSEVVRKLFLLSGNQCAFPECERPIILKDGTYVGEICHIRAAEPGGERFDRQQSNEERRAFENLLLMCHDHHVVTNDVDQFPVSRMIEIKTQHEARFSHGLANLEKSERVQIIDSVLFLGGLGGTAPGAGGGGGGAIGPGAKAGAGGSGGRLLGAGEVDLEALMEPLRDGLSPSAGGGGAPAVGPGALAGSGGGGGDRLSSLLNGELLRRLGIVRFGIRVGDGGQSGRDGQPTGYDLIDDRGNILISVNAPAGHSGDTRVVRPLTSEMRRSHDQAVIRVQAAFLANSVEIRDGLFNVLSGGWVSYSCASFPVELNWPLILQIAICGIRPGGEMSASVTLISPEYVETLLETVQIARSSTDANPYWVSVLSLRPTITNAGRWTLSIRSVDRELAYVPIEVKEIV